VDLSLILALSFAPGAFWLWYFYKKDRIEPEPGHLVIKTYLWGMAAVVPAILLELPFSGLFLILVAAPIIEEFVKYFAVRRTIYPHAEFNEPMDGIVYSAAAALGFASVENVFYLLRTAQSSGQAAAGEVSIFGAVFGVIFTRAVLSVPGHVIFSLMWGEALGIAKFAPPERRSPIIRWGILLAIGAHAAFNFMVTFVPLVSVFMLIFVSALWRTAHRRIEKALAASPHQ